MAMGFAWRRSKLRSAAAFGIRIRRFCRRRCAVTKPRSSLTEPSMTQISTASGDIHPRNRWIAALLSLGLPGLGQLYCGDLNKALWLFLGFVLIGCFPGVTIAALYVPAVLMLPLLLISAAATLVLWGFSIVDAWRSAARRQVYTRREWQVSGL